jgi:AraC-like DNA-binding protein
MVIPCDEQLWQATVSQPNNGLVTAFRAQSPQALHAVPFEHSTLMIVLRGEKQLHGLSHNSVTAGHMLMVPAGTELTFTNHPQPTYGYRALILAFDAEQLMHLPAAPVSHQPQISTHDPLLLQLIAQWMQLPAQSNWLGHRRREILDRLLQLGFAAQLQAGHSLQWRHKLQRLVQQDLSHDWTLEAVCQALAISESSLRRKLKAEGAGFRPLLEQWRLVHGLNLLQTTHYPIQQLALECGYQSASRFAERFRQRFGMTPQALRHSLSD